MNEQAATPSDSGDEERLRLVLLPGMDGTGTLFRPFIAALGAATDVIVGHYPTDEPLGYAALAPLAQQFLPQSGRYVLLGESFSGPLSIMLAAAHPPGLLGLVLCCSFVRPPWPWLSPVAPLCGLLPVASAPHWLLSRVLLGPRAIPEMRAALHSAINRVAPRVLRARLRAIMTVDVTAELAKITVPVLYLRGARDCLVTCRAARNVMRCAPQTRVETLPTHHLLLQTAPEAAAAVVQDFASACVARARLSESEPAIGG